MVEMKNVPKRATKMNKGMKNLPFRIGIKRLSFCRERSVREGMALL